MDPAQGDTSVGEIVSEDERGIRVDETQLPLTLKVPARTPGQPAQPAVSGEMRLYVREQEMLLAVIYLARKKHLGPVPYAPTELLALYRKISAVPMVYEPNP
jgi:hypothetical protein